MASPVIQPADELARRKSYTRWRRGAAEIRGLVFVGVLCGLALAAAPLAEALRSLTPNFYLDLAIFSLVNAVAISAGVVAGGIPVLLVERKFGAYRATFGQWGRRAGKRAAVLAVVLLWWFWATYLPLHLAGEWWWAWTSAALAAGFAMYVYIAPLLLLPFYYAVEPLPSGALRERITGLMSRAGLRVERIQRLRLGDFTNKANALVAGFGRSRAVLVSDTLLEICTEEEAAALVAHEIGHTALAHIAKRVTWMSVSLAASVGAAACLARYGLLPFRADRARLDDLANAPALFGAMMLAAFYCLVFLLRLYRRHERQADQYGWRLAPELVPAFISGLGKIDARNLLYFDKKQEHKYSHPATHGRIELAQKFLAARQSL